MSAPVFVSGASGQLARQVITLLLDAGQAVVAGTRSPDKVADLAERGARVCRVDFDEPETVEAALRGVERALIVSTDAIGARLEAQRAAVVAAAEAGVKHVVYTSVVNAHNEQMALSGEHRATEIAIRDAFDSYTILRNNLYAELVFGALDGVRATGQLVTARGDGRIAWVSRGDCARAAAAALSDGFDGARILNIAGPQALSGDDMAIILSDLLDSPVKHVSIPGPALREGLVGAGVPGPLADALVGFDVSAAAGLLGDAPGDLEALTGTAGRSLRAVLGS